MKQLFTTVLSLISGFVFSQNYLNQVLVLNEGYFDYTNNVIIDPVTVGTYNPVTQSYQTLNTLQNMRFASDLVIDGNFYYVAADTKIFKFDLNTHNLITEVSCPGVRNLAVYQNKLIATRGEYLTTYNSYLHVYDASNLQLIQAIDTIAGPKWASQNMVVVNDKVYVAVNNAYEWGQEKGYVGELNMNTLVYGNEIDLGPDGKNPDNLLIYGNTLYTVNNKDFSGSSISKINLMSSVPSTTNIANASTGCGTSALLNDKIVYQISMAMDLNEFDINLMSNIGPIAGYNLSFYELAQEPVSGNLYTTETDFFSSGSVHIFGSNNQELSNFNVGISPGTLAFDVRPLVSIVENTSNSHTIFPNPSAGSFQISGLHGEQIEIYDLSGKQVKVIFETELSNLDLTPGSYIVKVSGQVIGKVQII